jgi:hypothetical protein
MAITISVLNTPTALEPINTPLWFRVNSTSSGLTDFKYVFIPQFKYEPFASTGYTTLGSYKIPPRPGSGDGLFSPHRALKSFIQTQINPYITTLVLSPEGASLLDYRLKYGFEYNPNSFFVDTISVSGYMGLTFSTIQDFVVGDIITINKDNKNYNPQYDGTCSVTSVLNSYSIKTDKAFSSTLLAGESGYITNQFRITGTSSDLYTWNGTRQYTERTKDFTQYIIGTVSAGTAGKFLTNYDVNVAKPIRLDDYETLSVILPSSILYPYYVFVSTFRADNTLIGTYGLTFSGGNTYRKVDIPVGPMNLTALGIPFSTIGSNIVDNYTVHIRNLQFGFTTTVSEFRKYKIDDSCSIYEKQRVVFLNRLGGYDYFNFTLDSKRTLAITRTEYEKILNWNYTIGDRGKSLLAQKAEIKMSMISNWITETDSIWLEELLTSPEVYLLPTTGDKLPIIITDNSYEVKTYLRSQLFNLVLNYKFGYDLNLQNE